MPINHGTTARLWTTQQKTCQSAQNRESRGTNMDQSSRFRRNPDYIVREIVGENVLVPTGNASKEFQGMGTMNATGAFLWNLLEQERSLEELSRLFAGEYGLTEEQSLQDVAEFLEAAQAHKAVLPC